MTTLGFRILPVQRRPDNTLVMKFRDIGTSLISDNMNRIHAVGCKLRAFHGKGRMAGPAITVKTRPGDNLMVHKAIDLAEPGDVIVVDAGGETTHAIIGEIMVRLAVKKGLAGFVIDGCVRDGARLAELGFPVFSRGLCIRGTSKDKEAYGHLNRQVRIGEVAISPGDLVVGDLDGVVVIARDHIGETLDRARRREEEEREIMKRIAAGESTLDIYNLS